MKNQRITSTKPNSFTLFISIASFFCFLQIFIFCFKASSRHSSLSFAIFLLRSVISSTFAYVSLTNEAILNFSFSFSSMYQTKSLPSVENVVHIIRKYLLLNRIWNPLKKSTIPSILQHKTKINWDDICLCSNRGNYKNPSSSSC